MRNYFFTKLSDINFRIATHEGNANRRLASQAVKILLLPTTEVPDKYKKEFLELRQLVEITIKNLIVPGLTPVKLHGIQNRMAVKFIKLLLLIEDEMRDK